MAVAGSAATAARWAQERAIDVWLTFADPADLAQAAADGAVVGTLARGADTFAVFAALRAAGADDLRRVGIVAASPEQVDVARRAGAAAVVAVADDPVDVRALHMAEPDVVVTPAQLGALDAERYGSGRALRPAVLLNPGPALTTERVKRAAGVVDLCHREPEFTGLEASVRRKLLAVAGDPPGWQVAFVSGSGTAADELALTAAVRPGGRALVVRNGVYGDRFWSIAERAGIARVAVEAPWTEPCDPAAVAAALAAHPDVDAVAVVHHETTTGLLNPVREIAEVAHAAGALVVLDAVSSFGVEDLDPAACGIDLLACSSNKCLSGLPGTAFVLVSPDGAERAFQVPPRSVYLDLTAYLRSAESGSVPFTPAIPALAALDAALDELLEEGFEPRAARYRYRCDVLDEELHRLGLDQLVAAEHRSRTVRSLRLPGGVDYAALHARLKREGYVIYAGQGPLASEIFRVCCMGALEPEALVGFAARLQVALAAMGVPA
jgi:2-aminoethylphosphonate-pyruvate transaminase